MTELKPGDRVAVYGIAFGKTYCNGYYATVLTSIQGLPGWFQLRSDYYDKDAPDDGVATVHRKQCRKLVKKERRRVWIEFGVDHAPRVYEGPKMPCDAIEFLEVRKAKK